MPLIDFSVIPDPEDFSPVPEGQYRCVVDRVVENLSDTGKEKWDIRFRITEGEYEGRLIFDEIYFTDSALQRVKLIASRFGVDVTREVNFEPHLIEDQPIILDVIIEEYEDRAGNKKKRNTVPFAGYHRVEPGADAIAQDPVGVGAGLTPAEDDALPF